MMQNNKQLLHAHRSLRLHGKVLIGWWFLQTKPMIFLRLLIWVSTLLHKLDSA